MRGRRPWPGVPLLVVAALAAAPGVAAGQALTYAGGLQLATGDYVFQQRTTGLALYSGLDLTVHRLRLAAGVPVIAQSTPWISYTGAAMIPSGGPEHGGMQGTGSGDPSGMGTGMMGRRQIVLPDTASYDRLGVGDPTATISYAVIAEHGALPTVRLTGGAKAPLADPARGFGTGAWDYGAGLSLTKTSGLVAVFLDASYWVIGDMPDLQLEDGVFYSAAVGAPLGAARQLAGLVSLSGSTPVVAGLSAPVQVGFGLQRWLGGGRSLGVTVGVGLTQTAPDVTLGASWRVGLGR